MMTTSIVNTMNSFLPITVRMGNNVMNVIDWNAATVVTDFGEFPASRVDGFRIGRDTEKYITRNAEIDFAYKWVFITRYPIDVLRSGLVNIDRLRTRWRRLAKNGFTKLKQLVTESYKQFYDTVSAGTLIKKAKNLYSKVMPINQVVSGSSKTVRRREQRKRNRVKTRSKPEVVTQTKLLVEAGKTEAFEQKSFVITEEDDDDEFGVVKLEDDITDEAVMFHRDNWNETRTYVPSGTSVHVDDPNYSPFLDDDDDVDSAPDVSEDGLAKHLAKGGSIDPYLMSKHHVAFEREPNEDYDDGEPKFSKIYHGIPGVLYNHRLQVNALHDIPYIKMASQMLAKFDSDCYFGDDKIIDPPGVLYRFICEALDYEYNRNDISGYRDFVKNHVLLPSKETMYVVDPSLFRRLCKITGLSWYDDVDSFGEKDLEIVTRTKNGKSEEYVMRTKVDSATKPEIQEKLRGVRANIGLDDTKPAATTLNVKPKVMSDYFWRIWNDE